MKYEGTATEETNNMKITFIIQTKSTENENSNKLTMVAMETCLICYCT